MNPYPYVLNNPLKYVDPLGLRYEVGTNDKGQQVTERPNGKIINESTGDNLGDCDICNAPVSSYQGEKNLERHIKLTGHLGPLKSNPPTPVGKAKDEVVNREVNNSSQIECVEGTSETDFGWFSPQDSDDSLVSKTLVGTDNLDIVPDFVALNALKGVLETYEGGLGGFRVSGTGFEESFQILPFDNPDNWAGLSLEANLKEGTAEAGAYFERDEGFAVGSFGFGGGGTTGQGNLKLNIRLDELNIQVEIGGDVLGAGAMVEGALLDKRHDGTYSIISTKGLIVLKNGVNANFDIFLEDRDQHLQNK